MNKLLRGDCREEVCKLSLDYRDVQLTLTSPPYRVGWDYGPGYDDRPSLDDYLDMLVRAMIEVYSVTREGGVFCLNLPPTIRTDAERGFPLAAWAELQMRKAGWLLRESIEWVKSRPNAQVRATSTAIGNFKNPYLRPCRERFLIASKDVYQIPNRSARWPGDENAWGSYLELCKDVWLAAPGRAKKGNPLEFPTPIVAGLVYLYSNPGDTVLDPFAGTGKVGRVARQMGRDCVLCEIDSHRWDALQAIVDQATIDDVLDLTPPNGSGPVPSRKSTERTEAFPWE